MRDIPCPYGYSTPRWPLFFAALVTILSKIGIKDVDSHLATAIRTVVVLIFAWLMVFVVGSQGGIPYIDSITWVFLLLSGLATGGSWLCFFRALKLGNVNKVVPIDKSSTILTMLLAFIILGEPMGWPPFSQASWPFSAESASGKWTRTSGRPYARWWSSPLSWLMVFLTGNQKKIKNVDRKSWAFLILSGIATGASWLFFYHALKIGNASHVVPIDKLSIVLTMGFARFFLGERFTKKSVAGLGLLVVGTFLSVVV